MVGELVVVVHPDTDHGSAITDACQKSGIAVITFADPIDALSYIERAAISALVTAVRFGANKLHGIALVLMVRYRRPGVRALLIVEPEDHAEAQRIGECIPAPGDPRSVCDALQRLLGGSGVLA